MPSGVTRLAKLALASAFQLKAPLDALVAAALTILLPGATRSGLSRLSTTRLPLASSRAPRVGPRELKKFTLSSLRASVSLTLTAPTVITDGSWPGELIAP